MIGIGWPARNLKAPSTTRDAMPTLNQVLTLGWITERDRTGCG
jgi:hypothetical protein